MAQLEEVEDSWFIVRPSRNVRRSLNKAQNSLRGQSFAAQRLRKRSKNLYLDSRKGVETPLRGAARTNSDFNLVVSNRAYIDEQLDKSQKQLAKEIEVMGKDIPIARVCLQHEIFQSRKTGLYSPYKSGALREALDEHFEYSKESLKPFPKKIRKDLIRAVDTAFQELFGSIKKHSMRMCSPEEGILESNPGGTAGGYVQASRRIGRNNEVTDFGDGVIDQVSSKDINKILSSMTKGYHVDVMHCNMVAEAIIIIVNAIKDAPYDVANNLTTVLRRIQPGSIIDQLIRNFLANLGDAKVRPIQAGDPIQQVIAAEYSIPLRKAIQQLQETTGYNFYNTLSDPEHKFNQLVDLYYANLNDGFNSAPIDFERHDGHLRAEWMYNVSRRIFTKLYDKRDHKLLLKQLQYFIETIVVLPNPEGKIVLRYMFGSLCSGHPWTNLMGTCCNLCAQNFVSIRLNRRYRQVLKGEDAIRFTRRTNAANGDDVIISINCKLYIDATLKKQFFEDLTKEFESIGYFINVDKFLELYINKEKGQICSHWEQYLYAHNEMDNNKVVKLASATRYHVKLYTAERPRDQANNIYDDIVEQLSILNNTIGRYGNYNTAITSNFNMTLLMKWLHHTPEFGRSRKRFDANREGSMLHLKYLISKCNKANARTDLFMDGYSDATPLSLRERLDRDNLSIKQLPILVVLSDLLTYDDDHINRIDSKLFELQVMDLSDDIPTLRALNS